MSETIKISKAYKKNYKNLENYHNFKNYKNHKPPFMLGRLSPFDL